MASKDTINRMVGIARTVDADEVLRVTLLIPPAEENGTPTVWNTSECSLSMLGRDLGLPVDELREHLASGIQHDAFRLARKK